MSYFLTGNDLKRGRKVLLNGKIVTPTNMSGTKVMIAEDGKWHEHASIQPLTEEQMHEELVQSMVSHCAGRHIVTLKAQGRGVEFVMDDNTRVGLTCRTNGKFDLYTLNSEGERV